MNYLFLSCSLFSVHPFVRYVRRLHKPVLPLPSLSRQPTAPACSAKGSEAIRYSSMPCKRANGRARLPDRHPGNGLSFHFRWPIRFFLACHSRDFRPSRVGRQAAGTQWKRELTSPIELALMAVAAVAFDATTTTTKICVVKLAYTQSLLAWHSALLKQRLNRRSAG